MRYLPLTSDDRIAMLAKTGAPHIDALFRDVPKEAIVGRGAFDLPDHEGELEVERALSRLATKNVAAGSVPFFCGAGAYRHHVPAAVDHLIQRSEFLTSYTPYQPEIAQGTLQYLYEFQTQVALLAGMEVANASLYDGSTATAEAVLMAQRITRRPNAILSGGLHPHYAETTQTLAAISGRVIHAPCIPGTPEDIAGLIDDQTACVVVQSPDVFGLVRDLRPIAEAVHAKGALLIAVVTEIVSLGLVEAPGAMDADIVAAEGQSIGNGLNFGGPYVGLFATREKFVRQMPGRLVGETHDAGGKRGYVLTLSTREQHIRREKATSNICTNSGLCSLAFTIHLSLLGEEGFSRLARANHARAAALADRLAGIKGVSLVTQAFFNEFTLKLPTHAATVVDTLAAKGIIAGVPASRLMPHNACVRDLLIVAATETASDADCDAFVQALAEVLA
ncbi:MAG: aminomethyl-transferring glycine dehydrogenase subunit GcvPA [Rhizomicrobium sp.]